MNMKGLVWIAAIAVLVLISVGNCILDANLAINGGTQANETTLDDVSSTKQNNGSGRIPQDLFPVNYKIRLQPFVNGNLTIHGKIEIIFDVVNETDKIVLNMVDIVTLNETCKVESLDGMFMQGHPVIVNQTFDAYNQKYVIHLDKHLPTGASFRVSLDFVGFLNSKLVGFYLSTYEDKSGNIWNLAATQFSPTDARRAFPCFDEPLFKATFDIILVRQTNMTAWSNMPINVTKEIQNGWVEDHFERTVVMSTYIVGFLISNFNSIQSSHITEPTFKVLSRSEAINQTEYALFFGPKCLQYFEEYFKIKFPLSKLDMAAIPDFKFSGMENWGLIMYREAAMLFDPEVTTVGSKRGMASVIAHEISHQWFGNLVTPKWWSELWLKEGFANYMGYLAADAVEPSLKLMEYIVYDNLHNAFQLDSLRSSHPINVEVDHPDRITEVFDGISYDKGASIIRMMQHFITEDVYKKGMTSYLQELSYKNAVQEDLWRFLTVAWGNNTSSDPDLSVQTVMDSWTLKQGYPVVHVTVTDTGVLLKQETFLLEGDLLTSAVNFNTSKYGIDPQCSLDILNSTWWIPISYTTKKAANFSQTRPSLWMKPSENQSIIKNISTDSWILFNVQKTGFYRVNYDELMWQKLSKQLQTNHSVIHPLNRAQLIDDSFNLARAGKLPYSIVADITGYLEKETELTPWVTFFNNFGYVFNQARFRKEEEPLKKYLRKLLTNIYQSLGFEDKIDDDYETQSLRNVVAKWACKVDHPACIADTRRYFTQWLEGKEGSFQNIRNSIPIAMCHGIKNGNEAQWNKTFQKYSKSNVQTEKVDLLRALGCVKNPTIMDRFTRMALNKSSEIRKQNSATVFASVSNTLAGRNITWNIVKNDWNFIANYFGQGSNTLRTIIATSTITFDSEELLDELLQFTIDHEKDLGSVQQALDQSFEKGLLNSAWAGSLLPQLITAVNGKLPNKI